MVHGQSEPERSKETFFSVLSFRFPSSISRTNVYGLEDTDTDVVLWTPEDNTTLLTTIPTWS